MDMHKKLLRRKDGRWVEVEITLKNGCLSISGAEGPVITCEEGKEQALAYWTSFFEDEPDQLKDMEHRVRRFFDTPKAAAQFVLDTDGKFHGLDLHAIDGDELLITESCGQIVKKIREWFPELAPALSWHLNDMKAGCEHQEALGWGKGKDIALTRDMATDAQLKTLDADLVLKKFNEVMRMVKRDADERRRILIAALNLPVWTKEDAAASQHIGEPMGMVPIHLRKRVQQFTNALDAYAVKTAEKFRSAVFTDSLVAPCPVCGYKYGTAWLKRELPPEIVKLVTEFDG